MNISCEQIVEKYLLRQNPLYAFNFPISLLIAIIIFGMSKAFQWSSNSYVIQILIPILAFLLSMVAIDLLSKVMINKTTYNNMLNTCKLWSTDNKKKHNFEHFENEYIENNEDKEEFVNSHKVVENINIVENPIETISNLTPFPIESINESNAKCIENSNCCNLCSGTNNPCKIIAPIPGPQWMPQTAETVQNNLKNQIYTPGKC
jgi:phosphate/sulfate permease